MNKTNPKEFNLNKDRTGSFVKVSSTKISSKRKSPNTIAHMKDLDALEGRINNKLVDLEERVNTKFVDLENRMDNKFADFEERINTRMDNGFDELKQLILSKK
ncbi:MAG: hypothetical protein LBM76_00915 [Mycoplasmataceae bacterium]|jgi:hypothetical protein|nr:hypothetical protein [Mycoplasmataceae bacterium]